MLCPLPLAFICSPRFALSLPPAASGAQRPHECIYPAATGHARSVNTPLTAPAARPQTDDLILDNQARGGGQEELARPAKSRAGRRKARTSRVCVSRPVGGTGGKGGRSAREIASATVHLGSFHPSFEFRFDISPQFQSRGRVPSLGTSFVKRT
ncbi:hypothetical protein C8Q70DRAFT_335478 [Cubamyces menziesii]|nr:hypothetical protein C8Q70DRAFT_335478 [Cubamyces menziesii]